MGSTLGRRVVHIANLSHQPCYLNHSVLCSFKWDLKNKSNKKITVEKKDLGSIHADRNSETCRVETRSFLKGIDVNRFRSTTYKKEVRVSSPNNTISSISGKRSEREKPNGDNLDLERTLF
ncbi:hypothetical protein ACSBR2_034866 [Camellia fascicularis]